MQTLLNEYASNVILTQHYFYFYIKETHITSFRNLSNLSEHGSRRWHIFRNTIDLNYPATFYIVCVIKPSNCPAIYFLICKIYSFFYQNTYLPLDRFNMLLTFYINIRHFVSSINIIKYNNHSCQVDKIK